MELVASSKILILFLLLIVCVVAVMFFLESKQAQKNQLKLNNIANMVIKSPDFKDNEFIPSVYTCEGENISPQIDFYDVPSDAQSLVLIMDDPDTSMGTFNHWIMWNISPETKTISQNSIPLKATCGLNSANKKGYIGPCPPSGTHRYFFKLYALNTTLNLSENSKVLELQNAITGHIIAEAQMFGLYKKQK